METRDKTETSTVAVSRAGLLQIGIVECDCDDLEMYIMPSHWSPVKVSPWRVLFDTSCVS